MANPYRIQSVVFGLILFAAVCVAIGIGFGWLVF